jgi:hypothetical protein
MSTPSQSVVNDFGFHEPLLEELFAEPVIKMLMQRDGVSASSIERQLDQLSRSMQAARLARKAAH